MIDTKSITHGQLLWYCKLDLHEVEHVKNPYKDGRTLAKFPPNNVQCFTQIENLYISKQDALDSIIQRIECVEKMDLKQNHKNESQIEEFKRIMTFFDAQDKNLAFTQLISSIEERLTRLEQNRTLNG